ncbi:MAG: aspartyl protease family protein [Candidatus Zixiibacteriota bacterium]
MKTRCLMTFGLIAMVAAVMVPSPAAAQGDLTDPYVILDKYYEAIGGLDKVKAVKTSYTEGTIDIIGTGLKGTFKNWSEPPLRQRQEVDLKLMKQISGDNGKVSWVVDANGKLSFQRDEETLKRRTIDSLFALYEELNPDSKYFTLSYDGMKDVNGTDCYVVRIANSINKDIRLQYFDPSTFYMVRMDANQPDQQSESVFSDFRTADGLVKAFHQDMTILPIGQKQSIQITKYEPNVKIDPSLFEPPSQDVKDFAFLNGGDSVVVKFKYIENHIYLPVNVSGKERLWVLDSGAGRTVIDSSFAVESGLKPEGNLTGQGAGNTVNVSFVTLPPYRVGDIEFQQQKIVAINLKQLFHKILGLEVVGILGYDFLSRFATRIDYANETLVFYLPDKFNYTGAGTVIEAPLRGNFFSVPLTVNGEYSGNWNLDLGAGSISFHYPFAESHDLLDLPGVERMGFGAGGAMEDKISRFDSLTFAGFTLLRPVIDIPMQKGQGAFAQSELIGNIGNDVFDHFVLYLDYDNQKVIVEKGEDFGVDFPRDRSGIQLWLNDDDAIAVFFVAPNTPGAKAGVEKGDQLVSINGIPVGYFDGIIAIRKLFREKSGTELKLVIIRDNEPKTFTVTLEDIV